MLCVHLLHTNFATCMYVYLSVICDTCLNFVIWCHLFICHWNLKILWTTCSIIDNFVEWKTFPSLNKLNIHCVPIVKASTGTQRLVNHCFFSQGVHTLTWERETVAITVIKCLINAFKWTDPRLNWSRRASRSG